MRPFFYIANWKMNQSLTDAYVFIDSAKKDRALASLSPKNHFVVCPTFPHLGLVAQKLTNSVIALGAQTCSSHASGAYTGQVAARSLAEVGCSYCLIGHSERRVCDETNQAIVAQYQQLVANNITPIFCIGETEKDYAAGTTKTALEQQLLPLIKGYQDNSAPTLLIAYEPVWAIGSGKIPSEEELNALFSWLTQRLHKDLPILSTFFLYGGSVDENNSALLKKINHLDGLLIGGASLDFQKFKNIVV